MMSDAPEIAAPSLDGARLWLVVDDANAAAWTVPLAAALRAMGATTVETLSITGALGQTARGLIEQGADRVARTLRISGRDQPDALAFDVFDRGRPQLVLSDQAGVLRTFDVIRDTLGHRPVHVGLVSGVVDTGAWVGADAYIAPDTGLLSRLKRPGQTEVAFRVGGPATALRAHDADARRVIREEFQLQPTTVCVLVDVAGLDGAAIEHLVAQASRAPALTLMFHYADDEAAAASLRIAAARAGATATMFGVVDDLDAYAAAADLVVVGPGNPRTSVYLSLRRPVIAVDGRLSFLDAARAGALILAPSLSALGDMLCAVERDGVAADHVAAAEGAYPEDPVGSIAAAVGRIWGARDRLGAPGPAVVEARTDASPRRRALEPIGGPAPPIAVAPLTREAAKQRLAALIMEERRVDAQIAESGSDRDRWLRRLALAEESGDAELEQLASDQARAATSTIARLNDRAAQIRSEKESVRNRALNHGAGSTAATAPSPSASDADAEARFRRLEREAELRRLRSLAGDD